MKKNMLASELSMVSYIPGDMDEEFKENLTDEA
jgi:hypothetical protein